MKSPSKKDALEDRLLAQVNQIISNGGCGKIEGVEFDLRHDQLDQDKWMIHSILENVDYLPNETFGIATYNTHRVWFPWFGKFDAKALRAKISKLNSKAVELLIKNIGTEQDLDPAIDNSFDRFITLQTPRYFVERGDKLSIYALSDAVVGGEHLHAHDRIVKTASIAITKANGKITIIEPVYKIFGNTNIVNPDQDAADPFESILYRIVAFHKIKRPTQLKKFVGIDSDISKASALAYYLYNFIRPAWGGPDGKRNSANEDVEEAEAILDIADQATLLGYLWAKIEFEANLIPLADLGKQRKVDSKKGGEASGRKRRENAESGWKSFARVLAKDARAENPTASQEDVIEAMIMDWRPSWPRRPKSPSLRKLVGDMERANEIPKAKKRSDI